VNQYSFFEGWRLGVASPWVTAPARKVTQRNAAVFKKAAERSYLPGGWRDPQKRIPVLRPIARQIIESMHGLFAKPLTLWWIMR
jgi:hypothetical protein